MNLELTLALATKLPWIEDELNLVPQLVGRGAISMDLGAALGVYTYALAAAVGKTGRVLAVEPRRSAANRIRRFARVAGLAAVRVEACAVGARAGRSGLIVPIRHLPVPGRAYLHDCDGTAGMNQSNHFLEEELRPGRNREVSVCTVDNLAAELGVAVNFVKLDVEGAELGALNGATRVLSEDRPLILCEIEDQHARRYGGSRARTLGFLAAYGYEAIPLANIKQGGVVRNYLVVPRERRAEVEPVVSTWRAALPAEKLA